MKPKNRSGFTLLEVVVALAILGLALMAIYDLNAGAVAMHAYSKKLTVASMLARSKMTDLEQELYDKGFSVDDEEKSGDFSDEGWSAFKWRAKIVAPRTEGVSPQQLIGAIFNLPLGGSSGGPLDAFAALFGGSGSASSTSTSVSAGSSTSAPTPTGPSGASSLLGGMTTNMLQNQFTQLVDQITKAVREVHLTVTWKDGKQVETLDLVTHVVSLGQGGDRNGNLAAAAQAAATSAMGGYVNAKTGAPVPNPQPGPNGQMIDPTTGDPAVPRSTFTGGLGSGLGTGGAGTGRPANPPTLFHKAGGN
jgi:general secretion pathway protein I